MQITQRTRATEALRSSPHSSRRTKYNCHLLLLQAWVWRRANKKKIAICQSRHDELPIGFAGIEKGDILISRCCPQTAELLLMKEQTSRKDKDEWGKDMKQGARSKLQRESLLGLSCASKTHMSVNTSISRGPLNSRTAIPLFFLVFLRRPFNKLC
jgi:hypothetical protein